MKYDVISADGHVDLIWLPPDLFTKNASAALKDRMPHVVDGPKGPEWVSAKGAKFGLVNGMGSAGRDQAGAEQPLGDRGEVAGVVLGEDAGLRIDQVAAADGEEIADDERAEQRVKGTAGDRCRDARFFHVMALRKVVRRP